MRGLAVALATVALLVGCSSHDQSSPTAPEASPPTGAGVASDEPCTRLLPNGERPLAIGFRAEDLERMVLTRAELGGLQGFEDDAFSHGFIGNGELELDLPHPPGTCADLARFGRVEGFAGPYENQQGKSVSTSVHLFWDAAGARAWTDHFIAATRTSVGSPNGPTSFEVSPLPGGNPGDVLATRVCPPCGTWGLVARGQVVGWVLDRDATPPTIDVPDRAARLAEKIEAVAAEVATRDRSGLDIAALLSAPLPLATYGHRYADLKWDPFFGGCADTLERGFIAGDDVAADARRFGRVSGCTALYDPGDPADGGAVVRVFSSVSVYGTEDGAAGALAKGVADMRNQGGQLVPIPNLGDEARAVITPPGDYTDARALVRVGRHVLVVALQEREPGDQAGQLGDLATQLTDRVQRLLAIAGT